MLLRLMLGAIAIFIIVSIFHQSSQNKSKNIEVSYSLFLAEVHAKNIRKAELIGRTVKAEMVSGRKLETNIPEGDMIWLPGELLKAGVEISAPPEPEKGDSFLLQIVIGWVPVILLIATFIFITRRMQGGGGASGAFGFGKSRAKWVDPNKNETRFDDVAGCDEAKEDVQEFVVFLRDPLRFQKLGGHIPKGALLIGNPGCGKTLLARAIAGEARVPFFSISGSDFVEMFVGVGAARVRDMFNTAKQHAPCIIFIDEIDAVGRQRGTGLGGGNDEREQTLNQILVEMDGFEGAAGVIILAATNRPDVLDPALLRPGRFDRQIVVPLPDIRGREQILRVHMRKVPLAPDVNANIIARGTPGFSGADLANLVNEAALFAGRTEKRFVGMSDFERAKDKIVMGAERTMVMPEEERRNTAYHESGHAVVARVLREHTDPVHKVTIIPRGRALGVTMQLPTEDRYSMNKERILATLAVLFGGRIAEELFMKQMTTGASNDFGRATELARRMVCEWGMVPELGVMVYAESDGEVFLGRQIASQKAHSEETMRKVDAAIRKITDDAYTRARKILEENCAKVETMTKALLEWETIDAEQINDIMEGRPPRPPMPPAAVQAPAEVLPVPTFVHPDDEGIASDIGLPDKK
ncbi:MAG: cell division protein FtsH [Candidatus Lloydbacteria bacterium RIFCSPLOWO2_01_FULL_50_20]|uniref:ATP-dependent zinc metalloprotease FtsH n=1 Tax=Candidatus Lloydbacteria bacterium RIFCSPLOWO2_01_FULL_50_20 TaxID=1798665 RepID=A0A1G2DBM9_9BACT|nr:MAG: cell division protein FtsH [Candidatus Lloydbacteria bacterium RIFCSPLOWO2_01_FULL_50_20]